MRESRSANVFWGSRMCWPRAIRLDSDWFRDFSSIKACASDAVRSPINWAWAWRFWSVNGDGLGAGEREGRGASVEAGGAPLGLGEGDAEGVGGSARTPAGARSRASRPARLSATATLRPRPEPRATEGREFTVLPNSLQLLRIGRLLSALSNPKELPPRAPSCPIRIRQRLSPPPRAPIPNSDVFSHFCHSLPVSSFLRREFWALAAA